MGIRLLLVDADDGHRSALAARLQDDGFAVTGASGVADALAHADRRLPHLALTELSFADGSAEQLASEMRRRGEVPIVVVSACGDATARVRALDRYADDYVVRPYLYDELVARIRRVLRRALIYERPSDERVDLGPGCWIDPLRREVFQNGRVERLTPTEARLLALFLTNPGQVLPSELILQRVWCDAPVGVNTLWEFIHRLRRKLGDDAPRPRTIISVRGIGYRLRRLAGEDEARRA